jgi:uncharacterized protein (DUF2252 family)
MSSSPFQIVACVGDEPLLTLDGRRMDQDGQEERFLTRALNRFKADDGIYQVADPSQRFGAGDQAAQMADSVGVDRLVALIRSSSKDRKAMMEYLQEELGMGPSATPAQPVLGRTAGPGLPRPSR